MGLLSKVNYATKKQLGSAGRPLVVAGAAGAAMIGLGSRFGIELFENNIAVAGFSAAIAGTMEGILFFFGDDDGIQVGAAVDLLAEVSKLGDSEYLGLLAIIESSLTKDKAAEVHAALTEMRPVPAPSKHPREQGNAAVA